MLSLFFTKSELEKQCNQQGGVVYAVYQVTAKDRAGAEAFAKQIASGQTLGFQPDELHRDLAAYFARIVEIEARDNDSWIVTIGFPGLLFAQDMAGMLTVLFGKISFAPGIRLVGIDADSVYLKSLIGPRQGLAALRKKVNVLQGPMLMAILKPGIGPDDQKLAAQCGELSQAGVHFVKDDEVRIDASLDQTRARLAKVLAKKKSTTTYVTHLSGPAFSLRDHALQLQKDGAEGLLFCPYTYGLSLLQALCADPELHLPIFVHPAFTGILTAGPSHMGAEVALGTLMRWCGADAVLFPSPYGSIALPKAEALGIHRELMKRHGTMPQTASVPSAGITPQHVASIKEDFGPDVIINAGTGMVRTQGTIASAAQSFFDEIHKHFT